MLIHFKLQVLTQLLPYNLYTCATMYCIDLPKDLPRLQSRECRSFCLLGSEPEACYRLIFNAEAAVGKS